MNTLRSILSISGILLLSISAVSCKESAKDNLPITKTEADSAFMEVDSIDSNNTSAIHKEHDSGNSVVMAYLRLKNSLMESESNLAQKAARKLIIAFKEFDMKDFSIEEQEQLREILEDAIEQSTHISGSKLIHQREHFGPLSEDLLDLIAIAGTTKTLYQDFCPMYNEGKGAVWVSETKAIKNPYFGAGKMLNCGSVQKTIN
jgi:hypothetical protein